MELTPRRPRTLFHRADERVTFTVDRQGLDRRLSRSATTDPDVDGAKVRIRRRAKVELQAIEDSDERSLRRRVRHQVRKETALLVGKRPPRMKVDVNSSGGRVR